MTSTAGRATTIDKLPDALHDAGLFAERTRGRRPVVFLDYDGVLTPIVDRPEDALISDGMRNAVRALAVRRQVCVVSGRDRQVVQTLMGIDDLVVAGSHGFDIWGPTGHIAARDAGAGFEELIAEVDGQLRATLALIPGVAIEAKRASVAVHYRLVAPHDRARIGAVIDALLAQRPDQLKVTPGKMVYEVQPNIDWDKGRAVLYLLETLGLDTPDLVPLYLGDDITDEDAFVALRGRGVGIIVGCPADPEVAGRTTSADFALASTTEVERFLRTLAR